MKKLLITGSSGLLGSNIAFELKDKYNIHGLYKTCHNPELECQVKLDLTVYDDIDRAIDNIKPDLVIHCAALTNIDTCESDYEFAYKTNAVATKNLLKVLGPKTRFIHISTDALFDGRKGNYTESDPPSPLNSYARTKLEGEKFVRKLSDNHIIVRTNIFGWNRVKGLSFAEWVYDSLKKKEPINMFTDVMFSPLTTNTLSVLIDKMLPTDFTGILNLGSSDSLSKYDFGMRVAQLFGFDKSLITPTSVDTFDFKAKRPKNMSLNTSKARDVLGSLPTIDEELQVFYKKRGGVHETLCANR